VNWSVVLGAQPRRADPVRPPDRHLARAPQRQAEFLFGLATLKISHMQRALESAGWRLIGFTSGYDCEEVAPGDIKRVFEECRRRHTPYSTLAASDKKVEHGVNVQVRR
jgi:hypothetical protein